MTISYSEPSQMQQRALTSQPEAQQDIHPDLNTFLQFFLFVNIHHHFLKPINTILEIHTNKPQPVSSELNISVKNIFELNIKYS